MPCRSLGDDEGAREVDIQQLSKQVWIVGLGFDVGVDDAGGVDHDVDGSQVVDDLSHDACDGGGVPHVGFVELDGDAGRFVQGGGGGVAQVLLSIQQGDGGGACFGEGLGDVPA